LDLKPENLLLVSKDDDCNVKVADFGFAERITELSPTTVGCGTPQYVSPEILQAHPFNSKVDIWSIGIITYILLGGYPPFHDVEKSVLFEKIVKGEFEFHAPFWDHVTEEAKDFIRCMLVVDPAGRYSAWQLLEHPWLSQTEHLDQILPESERFRAHRAQRRFRAAVSIPIVSPSRSKKKGNFPMTPPPSTPVPR
jgi:calcium/calmodulin-dependent protein kinase I